VELEPRTTAPAHATGAVAFVPVSAIADDATFRLRDEGDVGILAASVGRLGQLAPIELRPAPGADGGTDAAPRYQVVAGFRRLAALRMLMRERVLARVHERLEDEDAWAIALTQALVTEPLDAAALEALRGRLAAVRVAPWAGELVDEALVRAPVDPAQREAFLAFVRGEPLPAPGDGAAGGPGGDVDALLDREVEADEVEASAARAPEDDVEVTEVTPEELADDLARKMWEVNQDLALAADSWRDLPEEGRRMILEQARWAASLLPHLEESER
jgi:ParB-like chromosome segregation protein Spo0J